MAPVVCFGALVVALVFTLRTCHVVALLTEASSRQSFSGWGMQETDYNMRYRALLRDEVVARLKQLGNVSDANDFLQRTFLSPAAVKAGHLIEAWMQDAGLLTWVDDIGNVHGRLEGANVSAPALLLGSHLDTVIDAGYYDGALGILTAIAAVKVLNREGKSHLFPRPIEIIAFSDEEGVRFQTTFLGSQAVAGTFQPHMLDVADKRGITVGAALQSASFEGTVESVDKLKYDPASVWGYVEVHIEQGPVLEAQGLPLGVVEAIAGQTRLMVTIRGSQGHAGTVPMNLRKDPMPAAAQSIVAIEQLCTHSEKASGGSHGTSTMSTAANSAGSIVCTVGEIHSWPGASNVIPGEVIFTVDVRTKDDSLREHTVVSIEHSIQTICKGRGVSCTIERKHEAAAMSCGPGLSDRLQAAALTAMQELHPFRRSVSMVDESQYDTISAPMLVSGAGHDAMAMSHLTQVGMLFVRCTGGISHSPAEHVLDDDIWASSLALLRFMEGVLGDLSFLNL
ncbi:hypothetical protein CY35_17G104100 [Sphagnum magellanicum]|nr:hypothetical protein CY35_17G104100 [Sphagnum magellanicum]KAH9536367.1 hypothetical protein CY35_17G104100 [Sphagnum magellanicum]